MRTNGKLEQISRSGSPEVSSLLAADTLFNKSAAGRTNRALFSPPCLPNNARSITTLTIRRLAALITLFPPTSANDLHFLHITFTRNVIQ